MWDGENRTVKAEPVLALEKWERNQKRMEDLGSGFLAGRSPWNGENIEEEAAVVVAEAAATPEGKRRDQERKDVRSGCPNWRSWCRCFLELEGTATQKSDQGRRGLEVGPRFGLLNMGGVGYTLY